MPSGEEREILRKAAQWLALLESGDASDADRLKLQHWRDSHVSHEQAWQKVEQLRQRFNGLPTRLAMAALDRPQPGRRAMLKGALGLAALAPAAWLLRHELPLDVWQADLSTSTGERKRVDLADGSTLQLNTASAVNLDLRARRLTLVRGEIALKVPGEPALTIEGPYGQVVLSQSEVCIRSGIDDCRVSVLSGKARLLPLRGRALLLQAGQQVDMQVNGAGPVSPFDNAAPGWQNGVLMAQNQPLGDFLRELSRYRTGLLRWEPELETLRVTGSFRIDDTDRVLSLLAASLPIEVKTRTRYWVTLMPRARRV